MMAISKRCQYCHKLYTGKRCPECTRKHARQAQEKNEARKLYGSGVWRNCRRDVRLRYMDYDIWQLGIGNVVKCDKPYVHHIVERDEDPAKLFDLDNLITVSLQSHEEIHSMYLKDKAYALQRIQKGIEEFHRIFG